MKDYDMDYSYYDEFNAEPSNSHPLIQYTMPNMSSIRWNSSSEFNYAGMSGLYTIANCTLNAVFPNYERFIGYAINYENFMNISNINITQVVWENKEPLGFIAAGLVFALILTLFGIFWCCAKCCCEGEKSCCLSKKDSEGLILASLVQKRDKCKRSCCGVLFTTLIVAFMFGLVCLFTTNEKLRMSLEEAPKDVDQSFIDTEVYIDTTGIQINTLFVSNYNLLSVLLEDILNKSGEIIKNGLSEKTGAQALNNLTQLLDTVDGVRKSLQNVETTSKNLKIKADQLQAGLKGSKSRLIALLDHPSCSSSLKCTELKNNPEIKSLRVENNFQTLPDLEEVLRELNQLLGTNVRNSIDKGKKAFDSLSIRIKAEVDPLIPSIKERISRTGRELANISSTLNKALESIPISESREKSQKASENIEKWTPYRYYAGLGICITLSFIFVLLTCGIFIGCCGKQPGSSYNDECCSRKTGSKFLNCGNFFIFLTGGFLTVLALAHFILAGVLTQVVCEAINKLDNRTEIALRLPTIEIKTNYNYQVPSYADILRSCKSETSAYHAFGLSSVYDIRKITDLSRRFKKEINHLASQVQIPVDVTGEIVFLTPEAKEQIELFSESKINQIRFEDFADELTDRITTVDLNEVITRLNSTFEDVDDNTMDSDFRSNLMNEIMILEALQNRVLLPMQTDAKRAAQDLRSLSRDQEDLTNRIKRVADAAEKAQNSLRSTGVSNEVRELAQQFEDQFVNHVDNYANYTYEQIEKHVGECSPIFRVFNSTSNTFCRKIGLPLSGFWFALSFLVLLLFPLVIISIQLARLYSKYKTHTYESETYYSTYNDRRDRDDTIPLSLNSSNGGAGRRHQEPKRGERSSRPHSSNNSRYQDQAHKAWNSQVVLKYGNGVTTPSTSEAVAVAAGEYERPPPYYNPPNKYFYPGPGPAPQ